MEKHDRDETKIGVSEEMWTKYRYAFGTEKVFLHIDIFYAGFALASKKVQVTQPRLVKHPRLAVNIPPDLDDG